MAGTWQARSSFIGLAVSLATFAICFALLEAGLAFSQGRLQARLEQAYQNRNWCYRQSTHPELLYEGEPAVPRCGTNSHGYRDSEHAYTKPPGTQRIVIIGDSVAIGQGIPARSTFASRLQRRLNARPGVAAVPTEVIVLGQSGYSTSQELFLMEHIAPRYDPDMVVWMYVLNDPAHPLYHDANGELGRYYYEPPVHTTHFLQRKLFELREIQASRDCPVEYHALLHCVYRREVRDMIARIGRLSDTLAVPVLFAIHPVFPRRGGFDTYALEPVHAQLRNDAEAAGLEVLDLLPAYAPYPPERVAQQTEDGLLDPWHPNAEGARVVAQALYRKLRQGGGLATTAAP